MSDNEKKCLEAIKEMSNQNKTVRHADLADYLGLARPSINVAISKLLYRNYISISDEGFITVEDYESAKGLVRKIVFDSLNMNARPMQVSELVDELGISPAKVASALKKLVEQGKAAITTDKGKSFYSSLF